MSERIVERLLHISFIKNMVNPYAAVTQTTDIKHDREQIEQLIDVMQESEVPVFVHVHLMGTHGPRFAPEHQAFSTDQDQDEEWMVDFYNDTVLSFDGYIGQLLNHLERNDGINNTMLIIYSDHPMQFNVRERIPLMFGFPNNEFAGRVKQNVQNLDIAPTILDFLQID